MKALWVAAVLALATFLGGMHAQAATIISVGSTPETVDKFFLFQSHHTFTNTFTLNVAQDSKLDIGFLGLNLKGIFPKGISVQLCADSGCATTLASATIFKAGPISFGGVSYATLTAGTNYFLQVSAKITSFLAGYTVVLSATALTPIPPALLMFMTALGGLGFASYRRKKQLSA